MAYSRLTFIIARNTAGLVMQAMPSFFLFKIYISYHMFGTRRKVVGTIPDGVIGSFIDIILPAALVPWDDSSSNKNEYQGYFLGIEAASPWG
jgi:hypothetical protein